MRAVAASEERQRMRRVADLITLREDAEAGGGLIVETVDNVGRNDSRCLVRCTSARHSDIAAALAVVASRRVRARRPASPDEFVAPGYFNRRIVPFGVDAAQVLGLAKAMSKRPWNNV